MHDGRRESETPAGTADRANMWMKNGRQCYARSFLKDHASRRKRVAPQLFKAI